jgi:DNA polymerase
MMISHNAHIDALIASWIYDWHPRLYVDTMGLARAVLSRLRKYSLAALLKHLGLPEKDVTLLPRVIGMDLPAIRAAGLYDAYTTYGVADADGCRAIFDRLIPGFPASELVLMDMVLRCAIEPRFEIDRILLHEHKMIVESEKQQLLNTANLANRGPLMSGDQFADLLRGLGVTPPRKPSPSDPNKAIWAFAKTDQRFTALLEHDDPRVQALVAARLGLRSTLEQTRTQRFIEISQKCDRMPIPLRFSGAHTHRLSGEWGINLQNLPRGGRLRRALMAPGVQVVVAGDASQIEARLGAWLAGCTPMLDAFRLGKDVYAEFASQVFGFPVTAESNPVERFIGKTAVLGLGYGLGHVKFADRIGGTSVLQLGYKVDMSEGQAQDIVYGYRRTTGRSRSCGGCLATAASRRCSVRSARSRLARWCSRLAVSACRTACSCGTRA